MANSSDSSSSGKPVAVAGAPDLPERRDFLYVATGAAAAAGGAFTAWPLADQMNPDKSVLALSSIEVDISDIAPGEGKVVKWRGKPVFIRRRTPEEIERARSVPLDALKDPETDAHRVQNPEWLIMVGICTHLGCVPLDHKGDYGGWFCPCHGSHYDLSGRIRKGPAPRNLQVPEYSFLSPNRIKIG